MEAAKRECILAAAVKAFTRFGFKKAVVDDIAREAGVAKGTVYLAYESKEDLFYQAVHRQVREWASEVSKLIDPRKPADEVLREVALAGIAYLDEHPLCRDLFLGIYHGILPNWSVRLEELRELGHTLVVEILRLGIKQGAFRPGIDVDEVARLLQDLQVSTYLRQVRNSGDASDWLERRATAAFDLILNGLRRRPAGTAPAHPAPPA